MTTTQPTSKNHPAPIFLSREQLGTRWNCSDSTIKRREKDGLKATHLGPRMVRYRLEEVEAFESR